MIRPITMICWVLALGAGLYLYRAKHEVELMDKHIEQIAKEANDLRAESRRLLDDWIRLGEPEQLHKYSDQYLGLKSIAPTQFVRLIDLPGHLPAPRADPPAEETEAVVPSAGGQVAPVKQADTAADMDEADAEDLPIPPIPPAAPTLTAIATAVAIAPPLQARPVTPRPAAGQPDSGAARERAAAEPRPADEPRTTATKPAAVSGAEPRQSTPLTASAVAAPATRPPEQGNAQARGQGVPPPQVQGHGMPPAQMQGQGAPPLQAQAPGRAASQPAVRPAETRLADMNASDPRNNGRALKFQPADPHGPAVQSPHPGITQAAAAPPQVPAGSLLGMSRGGVPVPLPAPTPVSTTWSGSVGGGSNGPGR